MLAQGEVFDFALGEFRSIPTDLNLNINRKINIKQGEFGFTLYRFDSGDKRNDGFDLFGTVIELATYLGMPQETAVTKFL